MPSRRSRAGWPPTGPRQYAGSVCRLDERRDGRMPHPAPSENRPASTEHLYGMVDAMTIRSAELVRAAVDGDEVAFTEIVSRYHRDLQRVAYTICRDPALAEDAAQATWAIAWRRLREVRDPDRLQAWLVAVAANEARRSVRSRRRVVREIPVSVIEL